MWLNFVRSAERDMQMKMQSIAIIVEQKVQVRKKAITVTSIHYVFFTSLYYIPCQLSNLHLSTMFMFHIHFFEKLKR